MRMRSNNITNKQVSNSAEYFIELLLAGVS